VVTFGEIMLRLSPPGWGRFVQADAFDVHYGGAEANVAVALAGFGIDVDFVTKVPEHEIGQAAVNSLRRYGVGTGFVLRGGERLGIYFLEHGASQRPAKVIYDRAHSAVATAKPEEFDWREILRGAAWFHFSGITPALGEGPAAAVLHAVQAAKGLGVKVSADLNYRSKLWSAAQAGETMSRLLPYVDVLITNEHHAQQVFGIRAEGAGSAGCKAVAEHLAERFGLRQVAITARESLSASVHSFSALLYTGGELYKSRRYTIQMVERVGGGDAFAAGLIYALLTGMAGEEAVEFAAAAACLKHTIPGDFNLASVHEVQALAAGEQFGKAQR